MANWTPYARKYEPLAAGSIDGTDTEPHDRAIIRAMDANYVPPDVNTKAEHTLFVSRLPYNISEDKVYEKFSRFGKLEKVLLVRDIVTGQSKGYGFVEFCRRSDACAALSESRGLEIEGYRVLIDMEAGHTLKGWVPRRLGGGWGGRKEAGQLRFGCMERPWRKPIVIRSKSSTATDIRSSEDSAGLSDRQRNRHQSDRESHEHHHETIRERHKKEHHYANQDKKKHHYANIDKKEHLSGRQDEKASHSDRKVDRERYHARDNDQNCHFRLDEKDSHYDRQNEKDRFHSRQDDRSHCYERPGEKDRCHVRKDGKRRKYESVNEKDHHYAKQDEKDDLYDRESEKKWRYSKRDEKDYRYHTKDDFNQRIRRRNSYEPEENELKKDKTKQRPDELIY